MLDQAEPSTIRKLSRGLLLAFHWLGLFLLYVVAIISLGALIGTISFLVFGKIFVGMEFGELALRGMRYGAQYFGVWAPSIAIVLCVMRAWKRSQQKKDPESNGFPGLGKSDSGD